MKELELLKRKLEREKIARKQAEQILETKALELFNANESLKQLNENLESQITQRTHDLQESEERYRNVIEQASDIIYSTDEEGYFTFVNPTGSNAFGYSQSEIIGKRYIDFVSEEYKADLFAYYTKIKEEGSNNDYFEFPIRSKTGEIHWIGQNVNRIIKANGEVYFNAVARDITLRKNAEKELENARQALIQSEVKYRSVLENMDLGLMEVDTNGIITRVYDKFCLMTGYEKEELLGQDAIEILVEEKYKDLLNSKDQSRLRGESDVYEIQIKRRDGKLIWVLISGAPFYNAEGKVIGSLGIHFNITERKILEQNLGIERQKAVKAQQAEQQFLANMSHEIRTPLNAIIGMSHLLIDSNLDTKQAEYVEILSDSAGLLKGLVSDILDISKIDSGMAEINETAFDLFELANRLTKTFTHRAEEKGLKLIPEIDSTSNCIVTSDRQWINQILINLLGNAVKFTAKGTIFLTIKKTAAFENGSTFYFEVKDTGIGIDSEDVNEVFSSFKQANTDVRREYGGTGLGLSISSRLVSLLGGELEVDSKLGEGSRFFFNLNLKKSENSNKIPNRISDYKFHDDKKIKVLVVEDNLMNQKYIFSLLSKWDINYDVAENGLIATEKYKVHHYDMIFMDLSMPVMDGYQATKVIRSYKGFNVPIIALTASTFLTKKELAMESGMTDFLAKPFTPEDLAQIIRKHLPKITGNNDELENKSSISINSSQLEDLYGTDYGHAYDMFETYDNIVDQELSKLLTLENGADLEGIKKQAHKIKPIFTMVGLNSISAICEDLEASSSMDLAERIIKDLNKSVSDSRNEIRNEMNRLKEIQNMKDND